jgi:hypothetical protein
MKAKIKSIAFGIALLTLIALLAYAPTYVRATGECPDYTFNLFEYDDGTPKQEMCPDAATFTAVKVIVHKEEGE